MELTQIVLTTWFAIPIKKISQKNPKRLIITEKVNKFQQTYKRKKNADNGFIKTVIVHHDARDEVNTVHFYLHHLKLHLRRPS